MFKLKELTARYFAVVKKNDPTTEWEPMIVYGFIEVFDKKNAVIRNLSEELFNSYELSSLMKRAIELAR